MTEHTKVTKNKLSASKLKLLSFNPNSIGKNPKRGKIVQILKNQQVSIVFLSDTRLNKDTEVEVKQEWEGKAYFSSYTSQARGVAILIAREIPIVVYEDTIFRDSTGNLLMFNCKYENTTRSLYCLYGPNCDSPQFYEDVLFPQLKKLHEETDYVIVNSLNVPL